VRLHHAAVLPDDPPHERPVHRIPAAERPAHLDPHHVAALRRRHHDRRVPAGRRPGHRPAGGVDARDVRHQVRQRLRQPLRVDLRLDRRGVHRVLRAAWPD
jgi:hypothetical protein